MRLNQYGTSDPSSDNQTGGYAWAEVGGRDNAYGGTLRVNSASDYDDEEDEASSVLCGLLKHPIESENERNLILPVVFDDDPIMQQHWSS